MRTCENGHATPLGLSFAQEVFLWVLRYSPLLKNQYFQIPIRPGIR